MKKEIIEDITLVLKKQVEKTVKNLSDNEIFELFELYMPYIDKEDGEDKDIEIIRETGLLKIHFRVNREPYLITIINY